MDNNFDIIIYNICDVRGLNIEESEEYKENIEKKIKGIHKGKQRFVNEFIKVLRENIEWQNLGN